MELDPDAVLEQMRELERMIAVGEMSSAGAMARLLNLDDVDEDKMADSMQREIDRCFKEIGPWYEETHGVKPSLGNIAGIAFMQGATWAEAIRRLEARERA